MNGIFRVLLLLSLLFFSLLVSAQNTRISEHNSVGWYNYFGTFKLNNRYGLHTEYQWRRDNFLPQWQQSLLRLGVNYQVDPKIQLRIGYAWIETFPYGEYPINGMGKDFTEHRAFQMAIINDKTGRLEFSHRFMLEQRWLGRYSNANLKKEDEYFYLNRLRYMFRVQVPLSKKGTGDKMPYAALYDEILIGFGKNVNENIFDQNRTGILLGYKFDKTFRLEAGFFNQTLQLGREINGRNVFQYNNGFILNAIVNLDLAGERS